MIAMSSRGPASGMAASVMRNFDRIAVRIVDIERLDRADRPRARPLHPHRHAAFGEMRGDLVGLGIGHETDMRRHPLLARARHRAAREVEMDFLLAEEQGRPALAHYFSLHAEHLFVEG